jgi:hypothetical protein
MGAAGSERITLGALNASIANHQTPSQQNQNPLNDYNSGFLPFPSKLTLMKFPREVPEPGVFCRPRVWDKL